MSREDETDVTTVLLSRACKGDRESQGQLVARLTPLLLLQVDVRLKDQLRPYVSSEDVVQEAWRVTLPKLADLEKKSGRMTPVLLKFLGTTIAFTLMNLWRRHVKGKPLILREGGSGESSAPAPLDHVPVDGDASAAVVRKERAGHVMEALRALKSEDQQILVLRAVECRPNGEVAEMLGIVPSAVSMRYSRALERLKARLPGSLFEDLETD